MLSSYLDFFLLADVYVNFNYLINAISILIVYTVR